MSFLEHFQLHADEWLFIASCERSDIIGMCPLEMVIFFTVVLINVFFSSNWCLEHFANSKKYNIYGLFHIRYTIKILINLKIFFLVLEWKKNDTYFFFPIWYVNFSSYWFFYFQSAKNVFFNTASNIQRRVQNT